MQNLKEKVFEKLKVENHIQALKDLPRSSVVQYGVAVLTLMALMSWLHIRPLGVIFFAIFSAWLYKNCSNLRIQTPTELNKHIERVIKFKQNSPTIFCIIASACLGVLAMLGHFLSGSMVVITGLIFAAIISTKYNFKIIKIEPKDFAWSEKFELQDFEVDDEYLPDLIDTNALVLERASDYASLTSPTEDTDNDDEKSDEVPSELLLQDSMPDIDESSTDDDLLPVVKAGKSEPNINNFKPAKHSQSEDIIEFKKGHFKRNPSLSTTSSSSEESLSKGLQFPDHTAIDGPSKSGKVADGNISGIENQGNDLVAMAVKAQTQALLANSSKLMPNLMAGLVYGVWDKNARVLPTQSGPIQEPKPKSTSSALDLSDDSDFEILEKDDFL